METEYGELLIGVVEKYHGEVLVETKADATERGGAVKVLSLEADVKSTGAEMMDGEAEVSGKVNYRLLYLDRQGRLCGLDYFKDFKCRVKGDEITPNGRCAVRFSVPDAEASLSGDEITLSAMVSVELDAFGEKAVRVVTKVEGAEIERETLVTEKVKRTERTIELEKIVESGPSVKKIVLFGAEAIALRTEARDEGKTLVGEVRVSILYLNEADEAVELLAAIPFAEGVGEGAAEWSVMVKNSRIVLTEAESGGEIEVEVAVGLEETAYEEVCGDVVTAAVGEKSEAIEEVAVATCGKYLGQAFYEETLGGTVGSADGGYVAFVRPGCLAIAEVSALDGAVRVEGVAAFQGVKLTDGVYEQVQGELPFSYLLPFEGAQEGQRAQAKVTITDVKGVMTSTGVQITAKVCVAVSLYERRKCRYLSDVTEGEMYPENNAGISVYFAEKGENAWTIAKAMKVLPSVLVKANPFLSEPLEEAKKVLIFRSK